MQLALLGRFSLSTSEGELDVPHAMERVIAYTALQGADGQARDRVAAALWPRSSRARGLANLRSVLWRRRDIGRQVLVEDDGSLRLRSDVQLDVAQLGDVGNLPIDDLAAPLLPGWYEDWVLVERERIEQAQILTLEHLATEELAAGRYGRAIEAALLAIDREPLREVAHQLVLRIHLATGNLGEALSHYESLSRLLRSEIGVGPSPATERLVARIGAAASSTGSCNSGVDPDG